MRPMRSVLLPSACAAALVAVVLAPDRGTDAAEVKVKVATPLVRVAEPLGTGLGSVAVSAKGDDVAVAISVASLPESQAAPLGVFLEDGVGADTFTQVATIDTLAAGAGKVVLASDLGVPAALGVATLEDLVRREFEVRAGDGTVLLAGELPGLGKFEGTKLGGKIAASPGSTLPKAAGTFKGTPSAKKGSEKFLFRAKGLAPGVTYTLHLEDAFGSGVFVAAGDLTDGKLLRDTARGDPLPLGVASLADLTGRAAEVRDGGTPVVAGFVPYAYAVSWPQQKLVVLDVPDSSTDRYLREVAGAIVVYRTEIDLRKVSLGLLRREGDGLWRLEPRGSLDGDQVVTFRNEDNDRLWWGVGSTADPFGGSQHFLQLENRGTPPSDLTNYKFVLRKAAPVNGKRAYHIESFGFPGEFLLNDGHGLTANGVRIGNDVAPAIFYLR